jgi:hypothetical protein
LPAHPRHARQRELKAIERAVSLGDLDGARQRIRVLAQKDPFDFRVVALFAEIHQGLADPGAIIDFIRAHDSQLDQLPAVALVHLGDALLAMSDPPDQYREIAERLFQLASRGHFEEREAIKVALGLRKVQDSTHLLEFLEKCMREHPEWRTRPSMLQLRGNANLEAAWKCHQTMLAQDLPSDTRERARRDCEDYMTRAERDLKEALIHGPDPVVAAHVDSDLEEVRQLRARLHQSRPPQG